MHSLTEVHSLELCSSETCCSCQQQHRDVVPTHHHQGSERRVIQYHNKTQPQVGPVVWPHSRTGSARPWPIIAPQAVVLGAGSEEKAIRWLFTVSDSFWGIKCSYWCKSEEGRRQSGDITWLCWVGYGTSGMLWQQRTERNIFPFFSPVSKISPSNLPFDIPDNINMLFVTPGGFSSCNLSLK